MLIALGGVIQAAADTEANKAVVLRVEELWNTGDLAIADEVFATDFVNHDTNLPDVIELSSYKAQVAEAHTRYSDFHVTVDDMVAQGDKVAERYTCSATHPNGKQFTLTGLNIYRFAGGKIVEQWWSYDMLGALQQVGAIPPMPGGLPAMQRVAPEDFLWGAPSEVTGEPGDPETNKAIYLRELDVWNHRASVDVIDELFATNFVNHDTAFPQVTDFESFKQWTIDNVTALADMQLTIIGDIIAQGDKVASHWTGSFTDPATGVYVTMIGTDIVRFADGKIVERWWAKDFLGVMQQMTVAALEANKAVVQRMTDEIWNQGNLTVADELFATDFVNHDPNPPGVTELSSYQKNGSLRTALPSRITMSRFMT